MLTLGMDTAGEDLSLALARVDRVLALIQKRTLAHSQAEELFPVLETLFGLARHRPEEVQRIAVATGPGSYTGLRNGLAVAKTLAQLNGAPVVGIDSLTLLLARVEINGLISPWLDIRRGEMYTMLVNKQLSGPGPAIEILEAAGIRQVGSWLEHLAARNEPIALVGNGPAGWEQQLKASCPMGYVVPEHILATSAGTLVWLAEHLDQAGVPLDWSDYRQVQPLYPNRPVAHVRTED